MKTKLILTVGNGMMGDDAAGPLLAQKIRKSPLDEWELLEGGSAPENLLFRIREISPDTVLIVDASDMDLEPGAVRRIEVDRIDDPFLMTTHTLPLSYLIESMSEFVPEIQMVGIQPEVVAFGYPTSIYVKQAVERVYDDLRQGCLNWEEL